MAATVSTKIHSDTSTPIAVKGKEAIMDALEDIVFGSVSSSILIFQEPSLIAQ